VAAVHLLLLAAFCLPSALSQSCLNVLVAFQAVKKVVHQLSRWSTGCWSMTRMGLMNCLTTLTYCCHT